MKRRANIAAGLLHEPHLLVLDEPTVGVDPQSRNAILETVIQLRDAGLAVLYTTHYMEEADRLCNRVGIIDGGHLVAEGTRRQLVAQVRGQDRVRLVAQGDIDALARACKQIAGVDDVVRREDGLELAVRNGRQMLAAVVAAAANTGSELSSVDVMEPDLEAVFLALTGKELRVKPPSAGRSWRSSDRAAQEAGGPLHHRLLLRRSCSDRSDNRLCVRGRRYAAPGQDRHLLRSADPLARTVVNAAMAAPARVPWRSCRDDPATLRREVSSAR